MPEFDAGVAVVGSGFGGAVTALIGMSYVGRPLLRRGGLPFLLHR